MRIYLPSTLPRLKAALESGQFDLAVAYAVTPALREWYIEGDIEELEYAAMASAARDALRLLADDLAGAQQSSAGSARRVVVAADVPDSSVRPVPAAGRAAVQSAEPMLFRHVVSALVDDVQATEDVRRAMVARDAAAAGDEDAQFVVDGAEDHELAWYAAQEIGILVELES
jgi:hypothetical protein